MATSKKMDETYFANFLKETTVFGELIRARQDEKQSLMDEFDRESKRFYFGKISEKALSSSVDKTNKELNRIDKEIKSYMKKSITNLQKAEKMTNNQEPKNFKATLSGVKDSRKSSTKKTSSSTKKKSSGSSKKKTVKKASPKPAAKKTKKSSGSKKTTTKKTPSKKKSSSKKKK